MKTVCGLLILILLAHLQCGGSCYAPLKITAPPCHQSHSKEPVSTSNSPCAQKSVIVSTAFLPSPVVMPVLGPSITPLLSHEAPLGPPGSALTAFNLRI